MQCNDNCWFCSAPVPSVFQIRETAHTKHNAHGQVDDPRKQKLRLVVRDDDYGWSDKVLGVAEVPLDQVRHRVRLGALPPLLRT